MTITDCAGINLYFTIPCSFHWNETYCNVDRKHESSVMHKPVWGATGRALERSGFRYQFLSLPNTNCSLPGSQSIRHPASSQVRETCIERFNLFETGYHNTI